MKNSARIKALFLSVLMIVQLTGCSISDITKHFKPTANYDFSESELQIERKERKRNKRMGPKGTWTIFVYLCGSNLESGAGSASDDMEEMIQSSANDKVKFVVETGGSSKWFNAVSSEKHQRYLIANGDAELVDETDNTSMGDSATLSDFLNWGVENYAAANMGLILWNHGGGCVYGACSDETAKNDALYLKEMDAALYDVYDNMTEPFEFIGFDACLMATIETAAVLATHANYLIASEETEPAYGWDYKAIGDYLAKNPKADGAELGKSICDSYYNSYEQIGKADSVTLSVTDLSKIDTLMNGFDIYAQDLYKAISEEDSFTEIKRTVSATDHFGTNSRSGSSYNLADLGCLVQSGSEFAEKTEDIITALNDAVVYKVNGSYHENASGLSIYYPWSWNVDELNLFTDICISPSYLAFVTSLMSKELQTNMLLYDIIISDFSGNYNGSNYSHEGSHYSYSISDYDLWDDLDDYDITANSSVIDFQSEPQLNSDGHYSFTLSDSALNDTDHVEATVYSWSNENSCLYELGYTGEIETDYTTGEFFDKFDGKWFALPDGQELAAYYAGGSGSYQLYTSPVLVNGKETNLRFKYDVNSDTATIMDIWDGTDENGFSSRSRELNKDDKIIPIHYKYAPTSDDKTSYKGKEYKYTGDDKLERVLLSAGEYWYAFNIYDIYGGSYTTDSICFNVDEEEQLEFTDQTHRWVEATCTEAKHCEICGETEGEPLGHDWKAATCTEPKTCKRCGKTEGQKLGHDWQEATYDAPKTCKRCGETSGEKLQTYTVTFTTEELYKELMRVADLKYGNGWGEIGEISDEYYVDNGTVERLLGGYGGLNPDYYFVVRNCQKGAVNLTFSSGCWSGVINCTLTKYAG